MSRVEAIAEAVRNIIKGKTLLDIGCGDGEQVKAFSKYAFVSGVDIKEGFNALIDEIPEADVYYIWINPLKENKEIADRIKKGTIILGANPDNNEVNRLEGQLIEVQYDKGRFNLTVIYK